MLWFSDLEKIIQEVYGQEYYSVLEQLDGDFKNGMYDIWDTADGEEWKDFYGDDEEAEENFQNWISGDNSFPDPHPRSLLWHLAENGHIPAGKYLINIWW